MFIIFLQTVKWLQVLVFNTNYSTEQYSFTSTKSNGCKYCYVRPIFQFRHTVKEFQVLLFNTNFSIQHLSFCTQLNGSTYCYVSLTIQVSISHLFAYSLNVKCQMSNSSSWVRVELGAIAMKRYFTLLKALALLEPYY